jgi:hypothetical protein
MLAEARSSIVRYTPAEAATADVLLEGRFEAWTASGLPVE